MKKTLPALWVAVASLAVAPLTRGERDRAMSSLHATRKVFLDAVAGLSEAQWKFKPAPETWSIAECAEHVTLTEDSLFHFITGKIMKTPAAPDKNTEKHREMDEEVLRTVADRSKKAQAPASLKPTGKWPDSEALTAEFKRLRDRTIACVRDTNDDLRSHFAPDANSRELDAYQWILLISAHTQRHVKQIQEVKSLPGYPKR